MNSSGRWSKTRVSRAGLAFTVVASSTSTVSGRHGQAIRAAGVAQTNSVSFPIAFLQALVPESVEVISDGHDGSEAQVRVSGSGGDFFTLTKALNQAILSSHELPDDINQALNVDGLDGEPTIRYDVTYGLAPGDRHLRITVRMTNISEQALKIPSSTGELALSILGVSPDQFQAPLGMVLLFGAGNRVFTPGVGYGVRFALDDAYLAGSDLPFPALPGILQAY